MPKYHTMGLSDVRHITDFQGGKYFDYLVGYLR